MVSRSCQLGARFVLGPINDNVGHVLTRLPGVSPVVSAILTMLRVARRVAHYIDTTPLRLLAPQAIIVPCAAALVVLVPVAAAAVHAAQRAWHAAYMDIRMSQRASAAPRTTLLAGVGHPMRFSETVVDVMRDFAADSTARTFAALELILWIALAALAPGWLVLLPARAAVAATWAVVLVVSVFGIVSIHFWAEHLLVALRCSRESAAAAAAEASGASTIAADTSLAAIVLCSLLPSMLFLGSAHFCEFAGLHWASAFIGFDDNVTWRSVLLISLNTFGPHVFGAIFAFLLVAREVQSRMVFLDAAAAEGHRTLPPRRRLGPEEGALRPHFFPVAGQALSPIGDDATASDPSGVAPAPHMQGEEGHGQALAGSDEPACSESLSSGQIRQALAAHRQVAELVEGPVAPRMQLQPWWSWSALLVHCGVRVVRQASGARALSRVLYRSFQAPSSVAQGQFDPSQSPMQWHACVGTHSLLSAVCFARLAAGALEILLAALSAFIQRRHLMIWALFAPKWMFEACFWLASSLVLLLLSFEADRGVLHLTPGSYDSSPSYHLVSATVAPDDDAA
jgi:hypothetical protein